jgi:potassium-transporting ATPase potassium-binding subunit
VAGWLQATVVIAVVVALHVLGRYLPMVFVLGLAVCLARQKPVAVTEGTLRTHTPMFVTLTFGVAMVLVFRTFLPALSLGPLAEGLH